MSDRTHGSRPARTFLLPLLALGLVLGLIWFRPTREVAPPTATPGGPSVVTSAEPSPFEFLRKPVRFAIPEPVMRVGPIDDTVDRLVDRVAWEPPDGKNRALDRLAGLTDPTDVARFVELAETAWRTDPLRGYWYLPALARVSHPRARELVLEAATHSSNMVRDNAARALGLLDDAAAVERLEVMLEDPYEAVRTGAIRELITMRAPEALDVLMRYAERDPDERIKHVLFRLGEDTENPEAIPILQKYMGRSGPTGVVALRMLAKFGDPSAIDTLYKRIEHGTDGDAYEAMQLLLEAPRELVEFERCVEKLEHPHGEMRRIVAELALRLAQAGVIADADAERYATKLERRLSDADYRARAASIAAMFELGRKDVVEPYEKAILSVTGRGLYESLEVTTVWCKDEKATRLVLQRMSDSATPTTPDDHASLITALGNLKDPSSIDGFLRYLREARPDEPRDGMGVTLSARAALHVSSLGVPAQSPLLAIANDSSLGLEPRLRAIDALRGIDGLSCAPEFIAIAGDEGAPIELRRAALESLPMCVGIDYFDALEDLVDELTDRELRVLALEILIGHA